MKPLTNFLTVALFAALSLPSHAQANLDRQQVQKLLDEARGTPDLHEQSADGADLSRVNFRGANLRGMVLKHANLSEADLHGANLDLVVASQADFTGAKLAGASLYGVVMRETRLDGADLSGARLVGKLNQASLRNADLTGTQGGANMSNQSMGLIRLILQYAHLDGATLKGADLSVCDARFASFAGADLTGTDLSLCDLRQVDFSGANLTRADFRKANIAGAKFHGITGRDSMKGLDSAEGVGEAVFD